jgi:hypothetical protein
MDFTDTIIPFSFFLVSIGVLSYFVKTRNEDHYTVCSKKRITDSVPV